MGVASGDQPLKSPLSDTRLGQHSHLGKTKVTFLREDADGWKDNAAALAGALAVTGGAGDFRVSGPVAARLSFIGEALPDCFGAVSAATCFVAFLMIFFAIFPL
jgi:hypothetical protein